jgi:glycosyltransferase 2 family protein
MKKWIFWLGMVISAVLLYFSLQKLNFAEAWQALKTAKYLWLIPGIGVYFIGVWVRAWRWHYLLRPLKKISTRSMFPVVTIGYMGNNIYPARAGEILRAVILKKHEGVPISASLATILVERVFDAVVMLAFIFLNLGELSKMTASSGYLGNIRDLAVYGAGIAIAVLVVFLAAAMLPHQTRRIVDWVNNHFIPVKFRTKVEGLAYRFLDGLESLRSPLDALMILFTSFVIWLLETVKYWFVMHAFPFVVSFFALMLNNGISNLATTLPSAPGYVGTFEAAGIAVLTAYGIPKEIAAGYTVVLHIALWLPITLLGFYYFSKDGLKMGEVSKEANEEQE